MADTANAAPRDPMTPGPMTQGPMIEMAGVNKWFGDFQALKDIHLSVGTGEKIVVCGPSGSGKSTMIRLINRLERHQSGRIAVDGIELSDDVRAVETIRREVLACWLTDEIRRQRPTPLDEVRAGLTVIEKSLW